MNVVEVSQATAFLRLSNGCLVVSNEDQVLGRVPVEEVATLLLSAPHATCSVSALAALASRGTAVIVCDQKMRPAGMMLPFYEHGQIATRINAQAKASVPLKKRLWGSLVRSKIKGQASVLMAVRGSSYGLDAMAKAVRPGDPRNVEGSAARRYWSRLFGPTFRRRRGESLTNKMLDYGYAVLRAAVTRSICTAGLHPSLSIHHHHRANAFALADDLIEPFRPLVDAVVVEEVNLFTESGDLTPPIKRRLAGCLEARVPIDGVHRTVTDALGRSASSLAGVFLGEKREVVLPWIG